MTNTAKQKDDLLDAYSREVGRKVTAEAEAYFAKLHLTSWVEAANVERPVERQQALARCEIETLAFLASTQDSDGGEGGELSPSSVEGS